MLLSDEESIDRVNPYVQHDFFMPGTSRQIIDFAPHKEPVEEVVQQEYRSPMCDYGVMVAGRIGKKGPCSLSRGLYPGRNIQYDEDVPNALNNDNNHNERTNSKLVNNFMGGAILLLLIAAL